MKRFLTLLVLVLLTHALVPGQVQGQGSTKKTIDLYAVAVDKTKPALPDSNIGKPVNDDNPVPRSVVSRGATCGIYFLNDTGFFIEVYVDDYYKGTIDAWGELYTIQPRGYKKVFCVTLGRTFEWKADGDCKDAYTFRLKVANAVKDK